MTDEHPADISRFKAGHVLAWYRLETKVGEGGMAAVYRARDQRLRRLVALKILPAEFAADQAFRRRFIGESQAAAAVDHPHIIPVYDHGEADGVLFISMRYVAGGDLQRLMQREGKMPPSRVVEIISPVASALDAAHRTGLVHRDVKPGNILVDTGPGRPDHVLLSDFGASKSVVASANLTGTGQFIGTAGYSAPEQIQELDIDGRADQYALACVCYEMLTGVPLFQRATIYGVLIAHVHDEPPTLTSLRPELPVEADRVMVKALAKTPPERYVTCTDFADALRDAFGLPPYHAARALPDPAQVEPTQEPPTIAVPRVSVVAQPARTRPYEDEPDPALPEATEETALDQQAPTQAHGVQSAASAEPTEAREAVTADAAAERPQAVEPVEAEEGAEPGAGEEPGAALVPSMVSQPDLEAERVRVVPDAGEHSDERKVTHPSRDWRRRLPLGAAAVVIIGAGIAAPFMLRSPAATPRPQGSKTPSPKVTSSAPVRPPRPTQLKLPASFTKQGDGYYGQVTSVAVSSSGTTLAIAGFNETCLWNIAHGGCTVAAPAAYVVTFSPNSKVVAGGALSKGVVQLSSTATGRQVQSVPPVPDSGAGMLSIAFRSDGKAIAIASANGDAYLLDIATDQWTQLPNPQSGTADAVFFNPSGTELAVGETNGDTYLWNVTTRRLVTTLRDSAGQSVQAVAFSSNGEWLATGDQNGSAYLWDARTGALVGQLKASGSEDVLAVAFSPDDTTLAVGDGHGTVYLWTLSDRKLVGELPNPQGEGVESLAFSGNGKTLFTGNHNGTVDSWPIG